jgi:FMN phosphatase YigB (HAD superfamily)
MEREIVIFDIDGTLADVSKRIHHLRGSKKNWPGFFAGMAQDKAIHSMVRLCNLLFEAGLHIVLCSGRNESHRKTTEAWLQREGVRYHELRLRRNDDRRSDVLAKQEMLDGLEKERILFVVDDRDRVVEMWRAQGLTCLQCAPGDF